jgi:hypothetical protein
MTKTTKFFCLDHAPSEQAPEPYDDGCPPCSVCRKRNYAVKPYEVKSEDEGR